METREQGRFNDLSRLDSGDGNRPDFRLLYSRLEGFREGNCNVSVYGAGTM